MTAILFPAIADRPTDSPLFRRWVSAFQPARSMGTTTPAWNASIGHARTSSTSETIPRGWKVPVAIRHPPNCEYRTTLRAEYLKLQAFTSRNMSYYEVEEKFDAELY